MNNLTTLAYNINTIVQKRLIEIDSINRVGLLLLIAKFIRKTLWLNIFYYHVLKNIYSILEECAHALLQHQSLYQTRNKLQHVMLW